MQVLKTTQSGTFIKVFTQGGHVFDGKYVPSAPANEVFLVSGQATLHIDAASVVAVVVPPAR